MSSTLGVTGSLETKQLRHLHWGRAATGKKSFASMPAGSLRWSPTLRDPVDRGLPGFSVREGVLQARILDPTGQYWLPCPSRALFPDARAASPPEDLVLPEPLRPNQLHDLRTWPSGGKPKSSRAASGADPRGRPTCRGGNKTTSETQGWCG